MNMQYIRYALEIARTGSISKAAENLSVAQPNLSRAVKELESSLGIAIFERTRTGMAVTPEGERLLSAGERILHDMDELEVMFEGDAAPRETLSLAFPSAAYISSALAKLTCNLPTEGRYDLYAQEVGTEVEEAIHAVTSGESRLGIIRIPSHNEAYYTARLSERGLDFERIATLPVVVLTSATLPTDAVGRRELEAMTPLYTKEIPQSSAELPPRRRITVAAPSVLQDILLTDPTTYALSLPLSGTNGLRQYTLADADMAPVSAYLDLLIYPKFYRLSPLDRQLLTLLQEAAKQ